MNRDFASKAKHLVGIEPQALSGTTDVVGSIIDSQGYESLTFTLLTDAIAVGSLVAQLLVEESDDSAFATSNAVVDNDLINLESTTAIDETDDKVTKVIGYRGVKRYVRLTLTVTTNAGTDVIAALAILANALAEPVDNNS